jgi:integrase
MPKKARELSALQVARLTEPGLHAVGQVAGLQIRVAPGGSRSWILRVMVGGKRRDVGLGGYPDVTLADVRSKARAAREKIEQGVDPVEHRRAARVKLAAVPTFEEATRRMIEARSDEWRNEKHKAQWLSTLKTYAWPTIGKLRVDQVTLAHVRAILQPIWREKTETASRLRGRIETVLAWATAAQLRTGDNPARWKGNLDQLLAKPSKVRKVKHHAALDVDAVPAFMVELREREGIAARALEFAILTAARSGEVRGARWNEIDLEAKTWTIPADRMKAGREHIVPLSPPAMALLKSLPRFARITLVFPSPTGKVLSDMALSAVVRRMKVDAVPHGFRSSFRDWAAERTNYPRDAAEAALAHTIGDKVEAAYRRGDLLMKRTRMMAEWARFCSAPRAAADVRDIKSARKAAK